MSDAVLVGIISVIGSVVVQLIVSWTKGRELDAKNAKREQKTQDAIDELRSDMSEVKTRFADVDRKLEEHNGYARRFGEIEKMLAVMQKDIEYGLRERNNNVNQPK